MAATRLSTLVVAIVLAATGAMSSQVLASDTEPTSAQLQERRAAIEQTRQRVWACQDSIGERRHFTKRRELGTESLPFMNWILDRWKGRLAECRQAAEAEGGQWAARDRDFHKALKTAAVLYGVSYGWLHGCSHDEGSDRMVWNGGVVDPGLEYAPGGPAGSSGAYGPMQFMRGTFYGNVDNAWREARRRGIRIPREYMRWNSNVGQAMTAAYMFSIGESSQWTGAAC